MVRDSIINNRFGLIGLPGAGKTRFATALRQASADLMVDELTLQEAADQAKDTLSVWCVIDVRSPLEDEASQAYLKNLLACSDGIVMAFMEASDLDAQSAWQAWLKNTLNELELRLPRYRWFSEQAIDLAGLIKLINREPSDDLADTNSRAITAITLDLPNFTEFCFEFDYAAGANPIHLEHLLLGLDASKQNLGMAIWRVAAIVKTTEYVNPVAIEGTTNRWDTYAGELDGDMGHLRIVGIDLDRRWLEDLVSASQLGG